MRLPVSVIAAYFRIPGRKKTKNEWWKARDNRVIYKKIGTLRYAEKGAIGRGISGKRRGRAVFTEKEREPQDVNKEKTSRRGKREARCAKRNIRASLYKKNRELTARASSATCL